MEKKKMLILRACGVEGEKVECNNIKSQAQLYGIDVSDYCPKSNDELIKKIKRGKKKYDYIYLSSHGNDQGFNDENGDINLSWLEFGEILCAADCMNEGCIILLSCCRAGLNQVAYSLFICCDKITYVVGPRQSLPSDDMLISFNILLYNLENRNMDPVVACEKIKLATDIRFVCFDRLETEIEPAYIAKVQEYEERLKKQMEEYFKQKGPYSVPTSHTIA